MHSSRRQVLASALAACSVVALPVRAQARYPSKLITVVVSYPAGGDTDASARIYADKLSAALGQSVIVDNKPGAGGMIGNSAVAKARADGYTLLYANSTLPMVQHVMKAGPGVAYDPSGDFTPIIRDQNIPLIMVTSPGSGLRSVKDVVDQARGGKKMTYGSPSTGTPMHIAAEIFNREAGTQITHIAYKGSAPAVADLLGNHVDVIWVTPGVVINHIKEGKLVPLAVAEAKRTALMPDVPTFAEAGFPGVRLSAWQGLLGPKGLPAEVVTLLNEQMNKIAQMADVQAKLANLGIETVGGTPAEFVDLIAADDKRYATLVKEFGIQPN